MKTVHCPSCGATFADSAESCPYCGHTHVTGAKAAYQSRMRTLRDRIFAHTETAALYRKIALKGIACLLLVAASVLLAIYASRAEDILLHRKFSETDSHVTEYSAEIDSLLAAGDYCQLHDYFDYRSIHIVSETDPYVRYAVIRELLHAYNFLFDHFTEFSRRGNLPDFSIDYSAQYIQEFYDMISDDYLTHHPFAAKIDEEATKSCAEKMRLELEVLMRHYYSFSGEEIAALPDMSKAEIRALLTERVGEE